MRERLAWITLCCAAAALPARMGRASPMEDQSAGNAVFSGPTSPHPSSIFINPASLLFSRPGFHLHIGGSLRLDQISVDRRLVDPASGQLTDGPSASTTTWSPGGDLAVWRSVLQERAVFGAMLHTPFIDRFAADQDALRYHVLGGTMWEGMLSAAGGFKVADWFIFGLGVSLGYSGLHLELARDTALEAGSGPERGITSDCGGAPCGIENPLASETITVDVQSGGGATGGFLAKLGGPFDDFTSNVGATLAVSIKIKGDWWGALSYVSPPGALPGRSLELKERGTVQIEEAPRDGGEFHRGRAEVRMRMPQSVWLGLRGPLAPGWDLVTSARWLNLSRHQQFELRMFGGDLEEIGVPEWYPRYRGMRDVFQLSGGLEGQDVGRTRFGGRARLEYGATPPANVSPLQIEGLNAALTGGVDLQIHPHWVVNAGYDLTWFLPVGVDDSAFDPLDRLACVDSDYDFDACRAAREGRAIPTAAGDYSRLRHTLMLSIRYDSL
jgi:hypothetical protein